MNAISDIANEHLLLKTGDWLQKPIDEDRIPDLLTFPTREAAIEFCLRQSQDGFHCRPYALSE